MEDGETYSGIDNLEIMTVAKNYNRYLADLIKECAKSTKTLVDFGAGTGMFAQFMVEQGHQVICIEPDAGLRARLREQGFVAYAALSELNQPELKFIYTLNVLEHIKDDQQALVDLFAALRPGGHLLVYVPAFAILYTSMDEKVGHYRRYRRRALVRALRAAGFTVDLARYVDSMGFFATLVYRLIGSRQGDINPSALHFYDQVIFPISRGLDVICFPLFGKNLLVYAHRAETPPPDRARRPCSQVGR
jgi:SAM-dependent methyltransferase